MDNPSQTNQSSSRHSFKLALDYRLIIVALLIIIAGMLVIWKPWSAAAQISDRTITVTGDATLKATPDEYIFTPSYDFTNTDKQTALNALTAKSNQIVAQLKSLGVTDSEIATNSSGNNGGGPIFYDYVLNSDDTSTYTLQLTVTLNSLSLAQKVQDYLTTTTPTGSVSPTADFSTAKRNSLVSQARDQATKDARAKAEQSASNLGFKVGAVKSVTDGSGFGVPTPLEVTPNAAVGAPSTSQPSLTVQPGENSLDYSVTVVYYVR